MKIQLLYFVGCPHVDETRRALLSALGACAITDAEVEELDVEAPATPPELRHWGSPTILIDGVDLAGETAPTGLTCRLYPGGRVGGVPPRQLIEARLREGSQG